MRSFTMRTLLKRSNDALLSSDGWSPLLLQELINKPKPFLDMRHFLMRGTFIVRDGIATLLSGIVKQIWDGNGFVASRRYGRRMVRHDQHLEIIQFFQTVQYRS